MFHIYQLSADHTIPVKSNVNGVIPVKQSGSAYICLRKTKPFRQVSFGLLVIHLRQNSAVSRKRPDYFACGKPLPGSQQLLYIECEIFLVTTGNLIRTLPAQEHGHTKIPCSLYKQIMCNGCEAPDRLIVEPAHFAD